MLSTSLRGCMVFAKPRPSTDQALAAAIHWHVPQQPLNTTFSLSP